MKNPEDGIDVDIAGLFQAVWRKKFLILFCSFFTASAAFCISYCFKPVYKSDIVIIKVPSIQVSSEFSSITAIGGLSALSGAKQDFDTQEAFAVLNSKALIYSFVTQNNLLPLLFKEKWDEAKDSWKSDLSADQIPDHEDAFRVFQKAMKISDDRRTGLITLSINWTDNHVAAKWANDVVKLANSLIRDEAISSAEKNVYYLQQQISRSSEIDIRQSIFRLLEVELKKQMIAKVNENYAFKVIDPAIVEKNKRFPKRSVFALVGFVVGLLFSLFYSTRVSSA